MIRHVTITAGLFLLVSSLASAGSLSGKVETEGIALPDARVVVQSTTLATVTNAEGMYSFANVPDGTYTVMAASGGFAASSMQVTVSGDSELNFILEPSYVLSEEITVSQNRARVRETPVAFSNVSGEEIAQRYTTQDTPDLLKSVPGVFSRSSGLGESDLYVRGFDSEHVQIMINNVPVNDPESQVVYWSNWTGLSGNAADIQVQRGVGSSLYGSGAFGGSVNIETDNFSAERRLGLLSTYGSMSSGNSNYIAAVDYSSGFLANDKINFYARYERKAGDSYIDGTNYDGHSYYLGFLASLSERQSLTINFHGAPQKHNQAGNVQDPELLDRFGRTWNRRNHPYQENYFFKPVFEVHHDFSIDSSSQLNTTFFFTTGEGGGRYLRNDHVNLETGAIERLITGSFSPNRNYTTNSIYNNSWKNDSQNIHTQYGASSSYKKVFNPMFTMVAGAELRFWSAEHYADSELFEFADEGQGKPAMQVRNVEQRYNYDGDVQSTSLFARGQWSPIPEKLSILLDAQWANYDQEVTEKPIRQYDFYNRAWTDIYARANRDIISNWNTDGGVATATVTPNPDATNDLYKRDYSFFAPKFGVNWNATDTLNVFGNYSIAKKEPKVGDWYNRGAVPQTEAEQNIKEESLNDFEIGFAFRTRRHNLSVNLYQMQFEDKIESITDSLGDRRTINAGNAELKGIEVAYRTELARNLTLAASFTYSDNKWKSANPGIDEIFGTPIEEIIGKYVPGSPGKIAFVELSYKTGPWLAYINDNYWDDYYVLYDNGFEEGLNKDGSLPYFNELNLGIGYELQLAGGKSLDFLLRANNILGRKQYVDASYGRDFGRDGGYYLGVTQSPEDTYFFTVRYEM